MGEKYFNFCNIYSDSMFLFYSTCYLARSLSYDSEVVLTDEPTGNLDIETEKEIMEIFKKLSKNENKCIIIVTHSENVAKQVDIIYELKKDKK